LDSSRGGTQEGDGEGEAGRRHYPTTAATIHAQPPPPHTEQPEAPDGRGNAAVVASLAADATMPGSWGGGTAPEGSRGQMGLGAGGVGLHDIDEMLLAEGREGDRTPTTCPPPWRLGQRLAEASSSLGTSGLHQQEGLAPAAAVATAAAVRRMEDAERQFGEGKRRLEAVLKALDAKDIQLDAALKTLDATLSKHEAAEASWALERSALQAQLPQRQHTAAAAGTSGPKAGSLASKQAAAGSNSRRGIANSGCSVYEADGRRGEEDAAWGAVEEARQRQHPPQPPTHLENSATASYRALQDELEGVKQERSALVVRLMGLQGLQGMQGSQEWGSGESVAKEPAASVDQARATVHGEAEAISKLRRHLTRVPGGGGAPPEGSVEGGEGPGERVSPESPKRAGSSGSVSPPSAAGERMSELCEEARASLRAENLLSEEEARGDGTAGTGRRFTVRNFRKPSEPEPDLRPKRQRQMAEEEEEPPPSMAPSMGLGRLPEDGLRYADGVDSASRLEARIARVGSPAGPSHGAHTAHSVLRSPARLAAAGAVGAPYRRRPAT